MYQRFTFRDIWRPHNNKARNKQKYLLFPLYGVRADLYPANPSWDAKSAQTKKKINPSNPLFPINSSGCSSQYVTLKNPSSNSNIWRGPCYIVYFQLLKQRHLLNVKNVHIFSYNYFTDLSRIQGWLWQTSAVHSESIPKFWFWIPKSTG